MFVDREQELAFFNTALNRSRPSSAQLVLIYGRRRVGKTVLIRHWADSTGLPTLYWAAEPEPAPLQRRKLYARMLNVTIAQAPLFESWDELWTAFAQIVGPEQRILILDEIPYAAEADPAFLASLQHAWDQPLKQSNVFIVLSGSHVHSMETLLSHGSPLFGRFTGQWRLQPLAFGLLYHFVPHWSDEERVALYAIVGGVPAYLEWLEPKHSLVQNIRQVILNPGGLFLAEPELLLYDEVREPRRYRSVLQAIGSGAHSLDEIANATLTGKTHLTAYLSRLQELEFVERRLPVTIHPSKRLQSHMGRYHLSDPFMRFYFRFVAPQLDDLGYNPKKVLGSIKEQLRGYVGSTAFEQLCRQWVARASASGRVPFEVQYVGSHWSRQVQVDVVGISWQTKSILLGECKWGAEDVALSVARELVERKSAAVLKTLPDEGKDWTVGYALFSRTGFTPAVREYSIDHGIMLIALDRLAHELTQ